MSWFDLLNMSSRTCPRAVALQQNETKIAYGELQELVSTIARRLSATVERGSLIAVWSPNDINAHCLALGILRAGCAWVPVNARSRAEEVSAFLARVECRVLFYHARFEHEVARLGARPFEGVCLVRLDTLKDGLVSLKTWLNGPSSAKAGPEPDSEDVAILSGTSGSTGQPKAVMTTHANLRALSRCFAEALKFESPPRFLATTPMTHTAGLMSFAVIASRGLTIVQQAFDPRRMIKSIESEAVDTTYLPPTALYKLLATPGIRSCNYSSLRHFLIGGMPLSVAKLKEAIDVFGSAMTPCYGQLEALWITFFLPRDWPADGEAPERLWHSCGRPAPFVQVEIMGEHGEVLNDGQEGEIVVRSDMVMKGYYRDPEATAAASAGEWHRTGDIGRRDKRGFLYIVGRNKDLIITGGFNVAPTEVEEVLLSHPAVADCVVFGVADPIWGEAVRAAVTLVQQARASEPDLISHCRARLADFKCPKTIEIRNQIPTTATGKASRRKIAADDLSTRQGPD